MGGGREIRLAFLSDLDAIHYALLFLQSSRRTDECRARRARVFTTDQGLSCLLNVRRSLLPTCKRCMWWNFQTYGSNISEYAHLHELHLYEIFALKTEELHEVRYGC